MKLWWYVARAGGLVAWALLAISMLWGLALSTRMFRTRPRPAWTLDLHRFLGGLAVLFTFVHAAALVADGTVHFELTQIVIPLTSRWHPVAVAWGVLALYLLLAIEGTSLLMKRMSNAAWKRVHRTGFALYVFATIHGVAAGTDARTGVFRWVMLGTTALIMFLWLLRVFAGKARRGAAVGSSAAGVRAQLAPQTATHRDIPPDGPGRTQTLRGVGP